MSEVQEISDHPASDERSNTLVDPLAETRRLLASNPVLAEVHIREILEEAPENAQALIMLGATLRKHGDAKAARAILEPLVEFRPASSALRLELGEALAALGENRVAIAVLSQAVNLDRSSADAWLALGEQLRLIGDARGSEFALAQHFYASVGDPRLGGAVVALQDNRPNDAEDIVLEFLEANPDDVNAIKLMAEIAIRLERLEDAEALLAQCLELAPDFAAARYRYATTLFELARMSQVRAQCEILLAKEPRNASYRTLMATALGVLGKHQESMEMYTELVSDFPGATLNWVSYSHSLKVLGRRTECIAACRKALELQPTFGGAWWSLANVKGFRFSDADIDAMESHLSIPDLQDEDREALHFSLGKAFEDLKLYERSFHHYSKGNEIHRGILHHEPESSSQHVSTCKALFTREFFHARAGSGSQAKDPIFIVGLPRAGSTLLEQILSCHSAIEGTMELPEMTLLARRINEDGATMGTGYPQALADFDLATLKGLGEEYLENTRPYRRLGRRFFTDKMPSNFTHTGFIHLILPNARIIDARRHPLGCCFGGFKQLFARGQFFTYRLSDLGRYYRDYVALMAHFDEMLPGKIHRVIYEQLVADPEAEVRRLLDYLELPFEEACLRFYETDRTVRTASSEQVRTPIFKDAVDHWRNYEPWLGPVKEALGPVLDAYPGVPAFEA